MKKATLAFIVFLFLQTSSAQISEHGWWTRDLLHFSTFNVPASSGVPDRNYYRFFTQPEIGHTFGKHWLGGIVGQYEFVSDRYDVPSDSSGNGGFKSSFYGAGPLLRYYLPISHRIYFMPEFFLFYSHQKTTNLYSQLGVISETDYSLNTFGAGAFPSMVCFLNDNLAFSITVVSLTYYSSPEGHSLYFNVNPQQWLLGVEYYFGKKNAEAIPGED